MIWWYLFFLTKGLYFNDIMLPSPAGRLGQGLDILLSFGLTARIQKKKNYKPILQIWKLHKKTHIKIEVMVT